MTPESPARKGARLEGCDYSRAGCYFVTFCVKDRHELLGRVFVGSGFHARPWVELSELGAEVQKSIEYINNSNGGVTIKQYVIMPNHVHMIVILAAQPAPVVGHGSPTQQSVVGRIKSYTTKRWNEQSGSNYLTFWQRSFYDRIIRDEGEYRRIARYIDENPEKWAQDEYQDEYYDHNFKERQ